MHQFNFDRVMLFELGVHVYGVLTTLQYLIQILFFLTVKVDYLYYHHISGDRCPRGHCYYYSNCSFNE